MTRTGAPGARAVWVTVLFLGLAPSCLAHAGRKEGRDPTSADRLRTAQKAIEEGKYNEAILPARWAFQTATDDETRAEALFLEGEGLFQTDEYFAAHESFHKILEEFPSHRRFRQAVEREYQIGTLLLKGEDPGRFLWFRVGREKEGIQILEKIVDEFPAERFAEDSQFFIATYYLDGRNFEAAQEAYSRLISEFPASKWAATSLYRKGVCFTELSRGPRYDPKPLDMAKRVFQTYLERYPRGDQVKEAEARIAEINEAWAEEEYSIARTYLRLGKAGSAEIYLRSILKNYPRTSYAEVARETLAGMGLPAPTPRTGGGKG